MTNDRFGPGQRRGGHAGQILQGRLQPGNGSSLLSFDMDDGWKSRNQWVGFPSFKLKAAANQSSESSTSSITQTQALVAGVVGPHQSLAVDSASSNRISHHMGASVREHHRIPSS